MALSQQEILEARAKYGVPAGGFGLNPSGGGSAAPAAGGSNWFSDVQSQWQQAAPKPPERFNAGGVVGAIQDVAHGAAKEGTKSFLGLGHVGQKIQHVVGEGLDAVTGDKYDFSGDAEKGIFSPTSQAGQTARQGLELENTGEHVGAGIEQLAEYAAPAGIASKGEKVIQAATEELPGAVRAGARILGKGAVQGAAAGGVSYADSGGDGKTALETALTAGVTRGALATVGEGANAIGLPERLYTGIFKNSKRDMLNELTDDALVVWKQSNPQEFQRLVDAGIVKVGEGGKIGVNQTLAEEALHRGLKGSVQTMANEVVRGQKLSEEAAQAIAKAHPTPISLPEEQYHKVLEDIATDYENVGFGEVSSQARQFAETLKNSGGEISAEDALKLRRFFDRMRLTTSFDKPASKLSLTQQNFKTLADAIRGKINSIPGMESVMKDYSFYIDAIDALAQEAKRTGNNQVLSLIDSILLSGGVASGAPGVGFITAAARKISGAPGVKTGVAQAIKNGVMGPTTSALMNAGANGAVSSLGQ